MINELEFVTVAMIMKAIKKSGISVKSSLTDYDDYIQLTLKLPREVKNE